MFSVKFVANISSAQTEFSGLWSGKVSTLLNTCFGDITSILLALNVYVTFIQFKEVYDRVSF